MKFIVPVLMLQKKKHDYALEMCINSNAKI